MYITLLKYKIFSGGQHNMNKLKTLFDISPDPETSDPQETRITLNEITLLSKMQAVTHYNLGASSIRRIAEDCGALVRIGKRVAYHRQTGTI